MSQEVTRLLNNWANGDQSAVDELMPLVYAELRRMAKRSMRSQNAGHTLQTTALINEAYVKLVNQKEKHWKNRAHFFGVAAQAMRHILVDYARSRQSAKRGGDFRIVSVEESATISDEAGTISEERIIEIIEINDALNTLARIDKRKTQIVELKFFGGLSIEEIATFLNVSPKTVKRDWQLARMWLLRELKGDR